MEAPAETIGETSVDLRQALLNSLEQWNFKVDRISQEQGGQNRKWIDYENERTCTTLTEKEKI